VSGATLSWARDLAPGQVGELHALVQAATEADGTEPVGEGVRESWDRPAASEQHVLASAAGSVRGYAHFLPAAAGGHPVAELVVHPAHRGAGTGRALAVAALDAGGGRTTFWAHGDGAAARAMAAELGLHPVRDLCQLRLDLAATLPVVSARADIVLGTYLAGRDDADVLRVNNAAFAWHPEQGGWTEQDLAQRRAQEWFDPAGLFLARDTATGALLGFHWTKVHPPKAGVPALGEVYVLAVTPAAQGRGLGRALTLVGLHHLRAAGLSTALLYVEADNAGAVHTYQGLGFERYHVDRLYGRD